jgi:hypothetical protein
MGEICVIVREGGPTEQGVRVSIPTMLATIGGVPMAWPGSGFSGLATRAFRL